MATEKTATQDQSPPLRLVRGDASPEEVAALLAVLLATHSPTTPACWRPPEWSASKRRLRQAGHPGPRAWRASALPH